MPNARTLKNAGLPDPASMPYMVAMKLDADGKGSPVFLQVDDTGALVVSAVLNVGSLSLGNVAVTNFPTLQAVGGTLTVGGGTLAVSNWPTLYTVGGTVTVGNTVAIAGAVSVSNFPSNFAINNFPGTQVVSGAVTIGAGSAVIGKVAIDHTTPGTTDAVVVSSGTVTLTAVGQGALTAVPGSSTNGTALGTMPAGGKGARIYLPSGASMTFTVAGSAPGSPPSATFTISQATTGYAWDEPLAGTQMIYVTAMSGSPLFRWL